MRVIAVSSTMGNADPRPVRPYRWRGIPGWDPALADVRPGPPGGDRKGGCSLEVRSRSAARQARFAQLRAEGMTVKEAGQAIGVAWSTAKNYEWTRRHG